MAEGGLAALALSLVADALTLAHHGVPLSTLGSAIRSHIARKSAESRDVLIEEMRHGRVDALHVASEDEAAAVIYRYILAARDGAAHRNLRLLAKVMVGLAQRDRLFADEFNKYADLCSRHTRDQIFVIGRVARHYRDLGRDPDTFAKAMASSAEAFVADMVPAHFASKEHLRVVMLQLNGMGLAQGLSWDETWIQLSPLMDAVVELADFDDLHRKEADG